MNIVALLTGRGNNTLKDKNVLPVLGKPLLYYPAKAAMSVASIKHFYVSSDDHKILEEASKIGYKKIVRPKELAQPDSQHIDVILHALKCLKEENVQVDILVVLLANAAIVKPEWIEQSINEILKNPTVSACVPVNIEMDAHPYRAKKLNNEGYLDTWFDFKGSNISTNRQDLPNNYVLCHNFWTLNIKKSVEKRDEGQQPWQFMGNKIKPIVVEESFDVHTEEDIVKTEKWLLKNRIEY